MNAVPDTFDCISMSQNLPGWIQVVLYIVLIGASTLVIVKALSDTNH